MYVTIKQMEKRIFTLKAEIEKQWESGKRASESQELMCQNILWDVANMICELEHIRGDEKPVNKTLIAWMSDGLKVDIETLNDRLIDQDFEIKEACKRTKASLRAVKEAHASAEAIRFARAAIDNVFTSLTQESLVDASEAVSKAHEAITETVNASTEAQEVYAEIDKTITSTYNAAAGAVAQHFNFNDLTKQPC